MLLADLAAACSDRLRPRVATGHVERGASFAHAETRKTGAAFNRSQLRLRAAGSLAAASSVDEVVAAARQLVTGTLDPAYVSPPIFDAANTVSPNRGEALPVDVADCWACDDRWPRFNWPRLGD